MPWLLTSFSHLLLLVLHCSILIRLGAANDPVYFCSRYFYDSPGLQDCSHALAALPRVDRFYKYYVEPQLDVAPPVYDWSGWADQRPTTFRQKVVQVPKLWSSGKQAWLDIPITPLHRRMHSRNDEERLRDNSRILQYCPHELCRRYF